MAMTILGVSSTPALAGTAFAYHGSDVAWIWGITGTVEDRECDGHYVEGYFESEGGILFWFRDDDGCGGEVSRRNSFDGTPLARVRVCEQDKGCSAWVNT
jgi:hypothetical protein